MNIPEILVANGTGAVLVCFLFLLRGKTRTEIAGIPDDGSDADLAALCTISVTELQKAALAAFAEE